jgi:hypothetical protein
MRAERTPRSATDLLSIAPREISRATSAIPNAATTIASNLADDAWRSTKSEFGKYKGQVNAITPQVEPRKSKRGLN